MIKGHGDDIYGYKNKVVSNFSSNVYGKTNMSLLETFLSCQLHLIHSYPEPDASSFVNILATEHNISVENICVTNGATEAIYMIAKTFAAKKSAILYPTFSEYADASLQCGHSIDYVESLENVSNTIDVVWICNPNNPTGQVVKKDVLVKYIESHPHQYIIIDQSYEFFTENELFSAKEAVEYKNVVVLHSMTKQYAIPGLRLGYITAHREVLENIKKYCIPWSVNTLAIEAGKFLLKNKIQTIDIHDYLQEAKRFKDELSKIPDVIIYPSETHFYLCKLEKRTAIELKQYLVEKHGILIRDASNFYGLDKSYFRVSTQSPVENDRLVDVIRKWI